MILLFLKLWTLLSWGAACCGGGASYPGLLTTPSFAQLSLSTSMSSVAARRDVRDGKIYDTAAWDSDQTQTLQLASAFLLNQDWQAGFRIPLTRHSLQVDQTKSQSLQLGDSFATVAWEYWPTYEYSKIKPRGFAFAEIRIPFANSFYDSRDSLGSDIVGSGQWELALGNLWLKEWGKSIDASFGIRGGLILPRTFEERQNLRLPAHFGLSTNLGLGYSPGGGRFRIGAALAPNWEQGFETESQLGKSDQAERFHWSTTLKVNYLVGESLSTELNYTDETLVRIGTRQVALSRTVGLQLLYHWNL